jgi:glucose-1-phosphate adenylyltransferase
LHENAGRLDALTAVRPFAAVPFGGKYRIIDFALSNMVNSGVYNVGILIPEYSGTLISHLKAGKSWDLDRKHDGLFLLLPLPRTPLAGTGDIDYYSQHLDYLRDMKQEHVILSTPQFICNFAYNQVFDYYKSSNADVTLVYRRVEETDTRLPGSVTLVLEKNGGVSLIEMESPITASRNLYMRMCVIRRQLLIDIVTKAMSHGGGDLIRQLQANTQSLKINSWLFDGYAANIAGIAAYYRHSMDLLQQEVWQDLFFRHGHIYTEINDSGPTKYLTGAEVRNSLVANNCQISGQVESSIIFRSVKIGAGSLVKNSVLMANTCIGADVCLENVICDKAVEITSGRSLRSDPAYPLVIKKGMVV